MRALMFVALVLPCSLPASGFSQASAPATEPAIKPEEALPTVSWKDAGDYQGKEVFVIGRVVKSSKARTGHAFLNFDSARGKSLVIFIDKDHYGQFPEPPEKAYRGKTIKVRGFVTEFRSAPQISVSTPEAIQIVPDDTPLTVPQSKPAEQPEMTLGETVTIGTYNVLNMFDSYDDPYTSDEGTTPKPRAQLVALAKSIRSLNADVLTVTEVENRGILQQFVSAFLPDMGYEVVLFEGNDTRGIDVGVLSRLPVGAVTSHRHLRFPDAQGKMMRYHRDLLEVRIEPPGHASFEVFATHLKSKSGQNDGGLDDREGEARETRKIFDQALKERPEARFVLCGDFNDTIESEPLKAILEAAPALTNFVNDLPAGENVSFNQKPFLSMIDFILASPRMARNYVPHSYHIVGGGSPEKTGSDHNPVVAKFKTE